MFLKNIVTFQKFITSRFAHINFYNKNIILKMNEVYFRHSADDAKVLISFRYLNKNIDRNFNFSRDEKEVVDVALNRIKCNLENQVKRKNNKKSKKNAAAQPSAENEDPVDVSSDRL
jgi:hypothetical protein